MGIGAIGGVVEAMLREQYGITGSGGVATLATPTLTSPVLNTPDINDPDIDGGTIDGVSVTGDLVDATTFIVDDADPTKKLSFELSAITGGQTSVVTVPDADLTMASTDTAQTISGIKTFGAAGAVGKLKVAGTTSGAATIDAPAVAGTAVITLPAATAALATLALAESLTNKTIPSPVLSGTVTGTYTLGGTPSITGPTISDGIMTGAELKGGAAGAAGNITVVRKWMSAMPDTVAGNAFVLTIPNQICMASVQVNVMGSLGDGDSTHTISYNVSVARIAGAGSDVVVSTGYGAALSTGAAGNADVVLAAAAAAGGVGATQTVALTLAVTRSAGAADNHVAMGEARLMNATATGVTIAAA